MSDVTVTVLDPSTELRLHRLTGAFLAGYRNANTRKSYLQQLHRWFAWCTAHCLDPLQVERTHVELYLRWFERQVSSVNTVCHGLSVLASFYRWLVQTGQLDTTPIAAVRRPSRDETPRQTRLTRHELADWLNAAEDAGGSVYAMACLLLLNGLRVSEVCGIDIDDLAEERWHHTVTATAKATRTPPSRSHRGPVPRSNKRSTAVTRGRCCATSGPTGCRATTSPQPSRPSPSAPASPGG